MTAAPAPQASGPGAPFAIILRAAVLPSAIAGLVGVVAITLWRGWGSVPSSLLGLLVGLGFFVSGMALLTKLVRDRNPITFMAVAMAIYLGQVIALLLFMLAFLDAAWLDGQAFGFAVLIVTIAWQIFLFRAWRRARVLVYDEVHQGGDDA